jgi:3-hydroxyisobutyrate dehydrogenase-like beta-hydroxyacid dehydrogenase
MAFPKAIGFIGVGTMGLPMAKSLLRACTDSRIFVYDVSETAVQSFLSHAGDRGVLCSSSRDVANKSVHYASFRVCPVLH